MLRQVKLMQYIRRIIIISVISFLIISITWIRGYSSEIKETPQDIQTTPEKIRWTWRKNFKDAEIRNLVMAWNGSRLLFSVREKNEKKGADSGGDVIIGLEYTGKEIKDWRVEGKIRNLLLDGSGKGLLVELEDGRLLFYSDWESDEKPLIMENAGAGATLSPNGKFIGVVRDSSKKNSVQVLSSKGDLIQDYTEGTGEASKSPEKTTLKWQRISFPFIENEKRFLRISDDGRLFLNDGDKLLWKANVEGSPIAVSSSILEGGILMVSISGEKEGIYFFNEKGELTGSAPLKGSASSLSCSNIGNICTAYGNSPKGQHISIYTPDGKNIGSYDVEEHADIDSKVFAADKGNVIVAGIKDKGGWSIQALDSKGVPVWYAPIEGGLRDFSVSWNGKRIAVITEDGKVIFFQIGDESKQDSK